MSDFYKKVYRLVSMIPPGRVCNYGQIAAMLGRTKLLPRWHPLD